MIETFTENTVPVVGKFYMVKCAIIVSDMGAKKYLPVIGFPHTDPQLGTSKEHYHFDGRFTNRYVDKNGRCNYAIVTDEPDKEQYGGFYHGTEFRRMTCKRLTTGAIPTFKTKVLEVKTKYALWYERQIGKSCKGKRCPHLGTIMHECNGRLVCPLHNLQGSIEAEIIIEAIEL